MQTPAEAEFRPANSDAFATDNSWKQRVDKRRRNRARLRKIERFLDGVRDSFLIRERRLVLGALALALGGGLVLFALISGR